MFTAAILPLNKLIRSPHAFVILNLRGNSLLHHGARPYGCSLVSALAGNPMARLRSSALKHRPGLVRSAHGGNLPLPRDGARPGTKPCVFVRIRSSEL